MKEERRNKLKTPRSISYLRLSCGRSRRPREETEKWWGQCEEAKDTEAEQSNTLKAIAEVGWGGGIEDRKKKKPVGFGSKELVKVGRFEFKWG